MNVRCQIMCQMFIIAAILYLSGSVLANRNYNCDCDVLQITKDGVSLNFTKQNGTFNEKPYYFSTSRHIIYWKNRHWNYDKYDYKKEKFKSQTKMDKIFFSFEKMCNFETRKIYWNK